LGLFACRSRRRCSSAELPYDSVMSRALLRGIGWLLLCGMAVGQQSPKTEVSVPNTVYRSRHLSGVVTDEIGTPVTNAMVQVRKGDVEVANANTDRKGRFLFRKLKMGEYEVAVQAFAFNPVRYRLVMVKESETREEPLRIKMRLAHLPHNVEVLPPRH
jgi:hypothetical protein